MLNEGKFWEDYAVVDVDGDGHCLLYSILTSIEYQCNENVDIDLLKLKKCVLDEAIENRHLYKSFINDVEGTFEELLYKYVFSKQYNTSFGDVVPYVIANALNIRLIIIDNYLDNNSNRLVTITNKELSNDVIIICRNNNHYNGIRPLHASTDIVSGTKTNHNATEKFNGKDKLLINEEFHYNSISRSQESQEKPKCPCKQFDQKCICSLRCKFQKHHGINICHVNARSLFPKFDEISWIVQKSCVDIVCISETWLNDTVLDSDIAIEGFTLLRKDRISKKGGGVAMYIKNCLSFKQRYDIITNNELEMLWCELVSKRSQDNTLLSCIYRPPNASVEYLNDIIDTIEKACSEDKVLLLLGDMNIDYNIDENLFDNPIFKIESLFGLRQLVDSPTRVTKHSSSLIDIILTSSPDEHSTTGVFESTFSDHYITYTCLNLMSKKNKYHKEIKFRNFNKFDDKECEKDFTERFNKLFEGFKKTDFSGSNCNDRLEEYWSLWKHTFLDISNKHAPFQSRRMKNRNNKWITPEIVKLMNRRDFLHKKAVKSDDRSKSNQYWEEYRKSRNEINKIVKKQKYNYYNNIAVSYKNKPKELWKELSNVFKKKELGNPIDISSDTFNEYFSTIGNKVADSFSSDCRNQNKTDNCPTILQSSIHTFNFNAISVEYVSKYLLSLPNDSKNDILGFDTRLLKLSAKSISASLTFLINISLTIGYCPKEWKLAKVTPAYKGKGDPLEKTNYRPLSVIAHLAKLSESVVHKQLLDYLTEHKFISIDQFAYLKRHSTQTCLHRLMDDILENVNENEKTALCFLDIRKCFDTINHDLLLTKLSKYGILNKEFNWFKSYLSDRTQVVINNNIISSECTLNIGVPQGTILGPILFLLFVNDLSNVIQNANINIFADDVVVYCSDANVNNLQINMQSQMNNVFNWYQRNRLALSLEKCSVMVINNKLKVQIKDFVIKLGDTVLEQVDSMKYLGVTIENSLKWNIHINSITKKVRINNARIRRLYKIMPEHLRLQLYKSSSIPIIDYASTVWGDFSQQDLAIIQRLEHSAARAISCNYDYINTRGHDIMKRLKMTFFINRLNYYRALLMYKAIHGLVPDHIANMIMFTYEVSNRSLRTFDNMNLYKPKPCCEIFKKSLSFSGPTVWNQLPLHLKESCSLNVFKSMYKRLYPLNSLPHE
jgi:hypothetical protein